MKKILIIAFLLALVLKAQIVKSNLLQFADLASVENKTQILISGSIVPDDYIFFTSSKNPKISLSLFKKMVELQGLRFLKLDDFYFIDNLTDNQKNAVNNESLENSSINENLYYIKLSGNSFDELNSILSLYEKNATYISQDNSAVFKASEKQFSEIISYLPNFDTKEKEQVSFKITILETETNVLKERGTEINSLLELSEHKDFKLFFNMLTVPYTQSSNVIKKSNEFYGVLQFLDKNDITKIKASLFLVAKNNIQVNFSSVKNLPFLSNTSTYTQSAVQTQNTYEYRDVGLKLTLKPVIVGDMIDVDLNLIYENLLSTGDSLTPKTSKKELKSNYRLKKGEIIVLSGINQSTNIDVKKGIPILKDIPILQYIFSTKNKELSESILSISIEVL
ncbi:type II secretion system protein D [Candidatus Campylobacter infans]|uniref:Type II secretion system protein D n=1 Tax=Candidatus Campylobacter infans TaxID=2561898 RepID=A0A7H9CN91_9BACT|nr:type II and III secretion system protein [Candidatus Campylobacter infans]QLI05704.1 type II secretion system protein D [Candidatus Campylobacter infans]